MQGIAPINQHKNRLQQVVPVSSSPCDVQKQIQLGWGWDI
jgi:hypothetical protein